MVKKKIIILFIVIIFWTLTIFVSNIFGVVIMAITGYLLGKCRESDLFNKG